MSLQELVYTSVSQPHAHPDDVKDILTSSERNNLASSITGLLLYDGERYIQILEGDASNVDRLFETIKKDHRHDALELLHQGPITGRSFQEWRMAYESLPMGILADLAENSFADEDSDFTFETYFVAIKPPIEAPALQVSAGASGGAY